MATCSTSDLLEDARCFACLSSGELELVNTVLLCRILQANDPMASCDVNDLLADANCFACLLPGQLQLLQTQLLCEILSAGGGGGSSCISCGAVDPTADPNCTCALYYNTATSSFWYWDDNLNVWAQLIGP